MSGMNQPMQVGTRATVKVSIVMGYYVDVEMPPDGDAGEQADFELFARQDYDDYAEKDVLNTEILESEPIYEDEYDSSEDWPQYYVSGEDVDEDDFVEAYYRVEGPNGPVSYANPNSGPYPATMFDFAMEAKGDSFRRISRDETPWPEVENAE